MTLEHFGLWGQGETHALVEHEAQLGIGQVVAVHDVVVVAQQAFFGQSVPSVGHAGCSTRAVHAGDQTKLAGEFEVVHRHVIGRVVRAQNGQTQREQAVLAGKAGFEQALDLAARMWHFPKRFLTRLGIGLGRAVEKHRPDSRCGQTIDARVGVRRGGVVVAPIGQCGGAAVDLVQRPHQVGNMDVGRLEQGGQSGVHLFEIFDHRPIGRHTAQTRLPGVHVGIDQARDDDGATGIDHLGIVGLDVRGNGGDALAIDQHVALGQVANFWIHRHNGAAADECFGHVRLS